MKKNKKKDFSWKWNCGSCAYSCTDKECIGYQDGAHCHFNPPNADGYYSAIYEDGSGWCSHHTQGQFIPDEKNPYGEL